MGSVVGERFKRAVDHCIETRRPLVCFSSSGGARMQEALFSLLQMAKTSAALARLAQARLPFISVMTDPTTGGVSASLAMLGDLNVAEPRALIGFAGPRVIQQTVRETLPEGFQRSEFLLDHGALDLIIDRRDMREKLCGAVAHADAPSGALPRPQSAPASRAPAHALARRLARAAAEVPPERHRPRPDAGARRGAASRAAAADLSRDHRRRHQRQGIHGRLPRRAVARLRQALRALHLAAPRALQRTHLRRRRGSQPTPSLIASFERIEAARGDITLTFFEYNALAALDLFQRAPVDVAVLEVGLGGRLDATNIVDADVGVICSIGLDHVDWLGDSLEQIGREKAGIFRAGRPAVLGSAPTAEVGVARPSRRSARAPVAPGRDYRTRSRRRALGFRVRRRSRCAICRCRRSPGMHQIGNAATALAAIVAGGFDVSSRTPSCRRRCDAVRIAGRFQRVPGEVEWILDVAHNVPAAETLRDNLRRLPRAGARIAVCGILGDKDIRGITQALVAPRSTPGFS